MGSAEVSPLKQQHAPSLKALFPLMHVNRKGCNQGLTWDLQYSVGEMNKLRNKSDNFSCFLCGRAVISLPVLLFSVDSSNYIESIQYKQMSCNSSQLLSNLYKCGKSITG